MKQKRIIDLDILRTLIILSALLQHFDSRFSIAFLSAPSTVVQKYIFTVGGFFFFTAGYMARKVYLARYLENPRYHSKIIFFKGLKILSLYITYVIFMHILTNADIPKDINIFLFDHMFFTKVLFTFGLLYMITPLFLFLFANHKKSLVITVVMITFFVVLYDSHWSIPYEFKILMLDRRLFLYPLFPSIVVYAMGFAISNFEINYNRDVYSFRMTLYILTVLCIHLFLITKIQPYTELFHNKQHFALVESITPYMAIIAIRYLTSINSIYKYLSTPYFLCVGIFSLHFYVISSLLIGVLSLSKESEPGTKLLGFIGICLLSYMFTFWRFRSVYEIKSLTKRSI